MIQRRLFSKVVSFLVTFKILFSLSDGKQFVMYQPKFLIWFLISYTFRLMSSDEPGS